MISKTTKLPACKPDKTSSMLAAKAASRAPGVPSRLGQITELLQRSGGASSEELCAATGLRVHSVRRAIASTLKKKGPAVASERIDRVRQYQIEVPE
jgi:hypothetical protein